MTAWNSVTSQQTGPGFDSRPNVCVVVLSLNDLPTGPGSTLPSPNVNPQPLVG